MSNRQYSQSLDKSFEEQVADIANLVSHEQIYSKDEQKDHEDRLAVALHDIYECDRNIKAAKKIIEQELVKKRILIEIMGLLMRSKS